MPRRPVDRQLSGLDSREAVWAAVRRFGAVGSAFTVRQAADETRLGLDTVREYFQGLTAAGYLRPAQTLPEAGHKARRYELARDAAEAPRVRRDGTQVTQGRAREQLWRTARILGAFSARDLAVVASTEECPVGLDDAADYVRHLHKAGYLAQTAERPARYRFLPSRYTGPKPPQVQRVRQVWDPNLGKVVWQGGAE